MTVREKTPLSDLTLAIQAIGFSPSNFATDILGISYQLFRYRVRQGKLSLEDYWKIFQYTGKSFDQLFDNPYKHKPKPISLTLRPAPTRLTPAPVEKVEPVQKPVPAPQIEARSLVIDVYDGLPPIE